MRASAQSSPPASATHGAIAAAGLAAFFLSFGILRAARPFGGNAVHSALFVIALTAAAILLADLFWQKVHRRESAGLDFATASPSVERTLVKLAGLLGSLGFAALSYWAFPEYHSPFYEPYFAMLRLILPPWLMLAVPYFYFVDRHMRQPFDGYWHMGKLVTLQWAQVEGKAAGQHLLGWLVKAFFLPLMFTYLCNDLNQFMDFDFGRLTTFQAWFDFSYGYLYFIDVCLASMGYMTALRLTDTHLRSAEPTMLGWAAALMCYQPFWSLFSRQYLSYETDYVWGAWLWDMPLLYGIWGGCIIVLTAIYVWATVMFGARFSNLTHRGLLTNGPYRWTKHPAYISKNLSWWMISIPFMAQGTQDEALRHSLLLLGLNAIYALRAKTEEWHLSRDPDYVNYALWVDENGLFRFIMRWPVVRYLAYKSPEKITL